MDKIDIDLKPSKKAWVHENKISMAQQYFKGRCFLCRKKQKKNFLFHHLDYSSGEKTYSDFGNTVDYNEYILPIVKKNPKRFMLLCVPHHHAIGQGARYGDDTWKRYVMAVNMTRKHKWRS